MTTQEQMERSGEWFSHWFNAVLDNIGLVIKGKHDQVAMALVCLFSEGHLLLEDVPGTGKTVLAKSIAHSIRGTWRRIQFTPDLLPADVTGSLVPNPEAPGSFALRRGPVFSNVVLGDEINRASPKTQAALLEVMEERHVTVDVRTYDVPHPFVVIATQNPVEQEGTYRLPEAQLDRFLMRTSLGYADFGDEMEILRGSGGVRAEDLEEVVSIEDVGRMISVARSIHVDDAIREYIIKLIGATRGMEDLRLGVSTRGGIALQRAAQTLAASQGRVYVTVDDVKAVAKPVMAHRMLLTPDAEFREEETGKLVEDLLSSIDVPNPRRGVA